MTLIKGRFQQSDAEKLITDVMRAKIAFHENRINTGHQSEEDIKHSEKRIKELEASLRQMQSLVRSSPDAMFDIESSIQVSSISR